MISAMTTECAAAHQLDETAIARLTKLPLPEQALILKNRMATEYEPALSRALYRDYQPHTASNILI
jgi:hypothetical protein